MHQQMLENAKPINLHSDALIKDEQILEEEADQKEEVLFGGRP